MGSLLRALTHNWKLKLLAFTLALLLWIGVSADQITTQWLAVPLDVDIRDEGWEMVASEVPSEVQVRFVGSARELLDLTMDRPRLVLRVNSVDAGAQTFSLEPGMVRTPRSLTIAAQDVRPGQVRLRFERVATREVPVRVEVARGPRPPFSLGDTLVVEPSRVTVRGSAAAVAQVEAVSTQSLDLSREDTLFRRQVRLRQPGVAGIEIEPQQVSVVGTVERIVERVIQEVPVAAAPGLRAVPATVEVRLRGPRAAIAAIRPADLRIIAVPDSVPARFPEAGVRGRLRTEGLPRRIELDAAPDTVRLFGTPLPADTTAAPEPAEPAPPGGRG